MIFSPSCFTINLFVFSCNGRYVRICFYFLIFQSLIPQWSLRRTVGYRLHNMGIYDLSWSDTRVVWIRSVVVIMTLYIYVYWFMDLSNKTARYNMLIKNEFNLETQKYARDQPYLYYGYTLGTRTMTFDRRFGNAGIRLQQFRRVGRRTFLDTLPNAFRQRRWLRWCRWHADADCLSSGSAETKNYWNTISIIMRVPNAYFLIFVLLPNTPRKSFFNYDKRQLCGTSQSDISRAMPPPQSNYLLRNWFFFFSTF